MSSPVVVPPFIASHSNDIPAPLVPFLTLLSSWFLFLEDLFFRLPGSPIIVRYIKSSYQDDPWRSVLELLLIGFALRTLFKGRTRGEGAGKNFVKLTEKEIEELVDEWVPQPLVDEPTELDEMTLSTTPAIYGANGVRVKLSPNGKSVVNLALPNWMGFVENDKLKQVAIDTLRHYGVGTCGPFGFYGYFDVHMRCEEDIAAFIGTQSAIMYSQAFAAISSVIPAFAKRGDIIVADRGVNFGITKGLEISRSTIRWYAHNDMKDLERVLQNVERGQKRKGGKLVKKFIVTEGIFENDGMLCDLPTIQELKFKYKYRLILDESHSFGMMGAHGKGITEYYNIPATDVDMIVGSMANGLAAGGGFVAGSEVVCKHQRINSSASVFSAGNPAMFATTASAAIGMLSSTPTLSQTLQSNILLFRQILAKLEPLPLSLPGENTNAVPNKDAIIHIPSHPHSALIHIFLLHPPPTMEEEERILQEVVDETLAKTELLITRARRLRGQEMFEPEPSLKICMTAALSKKDVEKAAKGLREALTKIAAKKK